jgi:hypothetical protein
MLKIDSLIDQLAKVRPVFHSEADFQHSFAWELHLRNPESSVRLERVVPTPLGRLHVDIHYTYADLNYVFELKYKTCAGDFAIESESFTLQNHSAHPPSRYDFLKDVFRLEAITRSSARQITGFAIFLTNDKAYWSGPRSGGGISEAFSLQEGRLVSGTLDWGPMASAGTKRNREKAIDLSRKYHLRWRDYSDRRIRDYHPFRCLIVSVLPNLPIVQ